LKNTARLSTPLARQRTREKGIPKDALCAVAEGLALALVRTLAGIFLAARMRAALQTDALAVALPGPRGARQRRGSLAHGFGNEFVAHVVVPCLIEQKLYILYGLSSPRSARSAVGAPGIP
jgi:hypothetical protein